MSILKQQIFSGTRTDKLCRQAHASAVMSTKTGPTSGMSQVEHLPILVTTLTKVYFPVVISESPLIIIQGETAGDATENIVLRNYLDNLAAGQGVQLYIDIHSYSQLFMTRKFLLVSHSLPNSTYIPQHMATPAAPSHPMTAPCNHLLAASLPLSATSTAPHTNMAPSAAPFTKLQAPAWIM